MTFSKLRFSRKENLRKCTSFEEERGTGYIWGNVYFGIFVFSCLSSTKSCLKFLLICFAPEIKSFCQSSLGNGVDFTNIMSVSPNFKKLRHDFIDERAMITTTLISSCHRKILVLFYFRKKRPENALLTVTVNYRKIVQKNKLCHSKQH